MIIFLSISLNMCFGCSKEPSHRDGFFEYPQHVFWLGKKKNNFQLHSSIWAWCIDISCLLNCGGRRGTLSLTALDMAVPDILIRLKALYIR